MCISCQEFDNIKTLSHAILFWQTLFISSFTFFILYWAARFPLIAELFLLQGDQSFVFDRRYKHQENIFLMLLCFLFCVSQSILCCFCSYLQLWLARLPGLQVTEISISVAHLFFFCLSYIFDYLEFISSKTDMDSNMTFNHVSGWLL